MNALVLAIFGAFLGFVTAFSQVSQAHESPSKPTQHLVFSEGVHALLSWEAGPTEGTESILKVQFMNAATHSPTDIQAIPEVELWMPSMGHGSSPTSMKKIDAGVPGAYLASRIYFIMGGEWEVRLKLRKASGETEVQKFNVVLGADGGHSGHH